ncbi:MAG: T9SS type A sorting domain-containing protein [Bacteroidota bacterium]|jgi:photosystem II stability/assembly factor-like uncharacterized protein
MKYKIILSFSLFTTFCFSQWAEQASGFTAASRGVNSISIINDSVVWAGAYDGNNSSNYITEFTKTSNGGTSWSSGIINTGLIGAGLANISAINKDTAWTCIFHPTQAVAGGVWKTTDGGISWNKQNTAAFGASSFPNFVYFWNKNEGMVMGDPAGGYFEIYTTNDGGNTWTRTQNTNNQLTPNAGSEYGYTNLYSVVGNTLWFGTSTGRVFKTTDKGITFTNSTTANGITDVQRICFADSLVGYACMHTLGNKSWKISKTIDGGMNWLPLQNNTTINNTTILGADICVVPGTNALISVGSDASAIGSSYSFDGGLNWSLMEDTSLAPQRLSVRFLNAASGWSGAFNVNSTISGIFKFQGTVGINSLNKKNQDVTIFPNPANEELNVLFSGFSGKEINLKIISITGEKVFERNKNVFTSLDSIYIRTDDLSTGVYFVEVSDATNLITKKLIIQ